MYFVPSVLGLLGILGALGWGVFWRCSRALRNMTPYVVYRTMPSRARLFEVLIPFSRT